MEYKPSELVLASDGSLYHIHLTADTLADDVILVGDPARVEMFKTLFDSIEHESLNREIHALTGSYHGHRFTALSTGMGCDNIDIVATELDAAANIDLQTRTPRPNHRSLNLIRIGTSGSLQPEIPCGSLVASRYAIGLDGLMNWYSLPQFLLKEGDKMQQAFLQHMEGLPVVPYCAECSPTLLEKMKNSQLAPQGRRPQFSILNSQFATTWESWDCGRPGKEDRSRVHNCYNGIGIWFYQALAGIRPDPEQPGYKHFFIDPQPVEGVEWVRATKPTQYGDIKVEIKNRMLKVEVPQGTTATVFPGTPKERTVGAGVWTYQL